MTVMKIALTATAFLAIGFGVLQARSEVGKWCSEPKTLSVKAEGGQVPINLTGIARNCSCEEDGKVLTHKNGTDCLVKDKGYNYERDWKHGKCAGGACLYFSRGIIPWCPNKRAPYLGKYGPQVGCAFICDDGQGKRYRFLSDGDPCQHLLDNGTYVNGTCRKNTQRPTWHVLCVPNITNSSGSQNDPTFQQAVSASLNDTIIISK